MTKKLKAKAEKGKIHPFFRIKNRLSNIKCPLKIFKVLIIAKAHNFWLHQGKYSIKDMNQLANRVKIVSLKLIRPLKFQNRRNWNKLL